MLLTMGYLVNPSYMDSQDPVAIRVFRLAGRLQLFYYLSRPQRRFTFVDNFLHIVPEPGAIGTLEP